MYACINQGLCYFVKKKTKFHGIFRGKFAEKSANFVGFSREKSQNSQKNQPISRDFSGQKVKFRRIIRGKFVEKNQPISWEISAGNFAKKQSVTNSRFFWIFLANFAKIDKFCIDMTSIVKHFFNRGIIICSFNNSSLKK